MKEKKKAGVFVFLFQCCIMEYFFSFALLWEQARAFISYHIIIVFFILPTHRTTIPGYLIYIVEIVGLVLKARYNVFCLPLRRFLYFRTGDGLQ